jgi:hypothetical protein
MSNASRRVRPLIPESGVSDREIAMLAELADSPRLAASSRELLQYWCRLDAVARRVTATKVVMFRLIESSGQAVAPALAAEEQFLVDEVELVVDPAAAAAVMRLLCVAERFSLVPVFRRFVADMADDPLP